MEQCRVPRTAAFPVTGLLDCIYISLTLCVECKTNKLHMIQLLSASRTYGQQHGSNQHCVVAVKLKTCLWLCSHAKSLIPRICLLASLNNVWRGILIRLGLIKELPICITQGHSLSSQTWRARLSVCKTCSAPEEARASLLMWATLTSCFFVVPEIVVNRYSVSTGTIRLALVYWRIPNFISTVIKLDSI